MKLFEEIKNHKIYKDFVNMPLLSVTQQKNQKNPSVKNILAVIIGAVAGGALNMANIMNSGKIIAPPAGADLTTAEGLQASMHLMQPKHFLMPFLAHALGTLLGAFVAAKMAATSVMRIALTVAVFFLIGGIMNVRMLPSPMWFSVTDLALAYIPMGWLGAKLSGRLK